MLIKRIRNYAFVLMLSTVAIALSAAPKAAVPSFCDDCASWASGHCGGGVCWTGWELGCNGLQYECDEGLEWCYAPCSM